MSADTPRVEVRRSARRHRTVSAYVEGETTIVLIPASMSKREGATWVRTMVARLERKRTPRPKRDEDLQRRAAQLSDRYLGGLAQPTSVRWVENQASRWGSCTPSDRTIRLSHRLQQMPGWVQDYVLVHELAHLLEPGHNRRFWAWVSHYPETERAKAYLAGYSAGARLEPPPGQADESDGATDADEPPEA